MICTGVCNYPAAFLTPFSEVPTPTVDISFVNN
jgi:hypothetical protein